MRPYERLSDTELLNLENRKSILPYSEKYDIREKFGLDLSSSKEKREFGLSGIGVFASSIGYMLAAGTLMYLTSGLFDSLGFHGFNFHHALDNAWYTFKHVTIPNVFHYLFLFLKGTALGITGLGIYTCAKNIKTSGPVVKINGKRI
jgi:hypothetical protein